MNLGKKSLKDVDSNEPLQLELSVRTYEKPVCRRRNSNANDEKVVRTNGGFLGRVTPAVSKG